jgi:hypothetical protein
MTVPFTDLDSVDLIEGSLPRLVIVTPPIADQMGQVVLTTTEGRVAQVHWSFDQWHPRCAGRRRGKDLLRAIGRTARVTPNGIRSACSGRLISEPPDGQHSCPPGPEP